MVFSSLLFMFIFLPAVLLFYYICPKGKNNVYKNALLFFVSLIFYAWGEPIYFLIMIFSTVLDYTAARLLVKYKKHAKLFVTMSVIINLGILAFFKYSDFFIANINNFFNLNIDLLRIALPIGISFYTFQTMSYTIDVYRADAPLQKNILSFGAYVVLFPQLIAGPIVRYKTIASQLNVRKHSVDKFASGIIKFTIGFGKKILIANNIGILWSTVSSLSQNNMTILTSWLGIIAFGLQIYFDFSGYSDMAIGLGRMFGFEFLENFNFPYIAKNITDFWRRWHISLGTWFREYLYIPLGGNRVKKPRMYINLFIVWFLTGFWHGAGWNFIIWGLYFGILIIFEKAFLLKFLNKLPAFFQHVYLILTVLVSWVFFAVEDLALIGNYLKNMFGFGNIPLWDNRSLYLLSTNIIILLIAILCSTPLFTKLKTRTYFRKLAPPACLFIWIIGTAFLVSDSYNPFLYFRF